MSNWPLGIVSSAQATGDFFQLWSWGGGVAGFFGNGIGYRDGYQQSSPVQSNFDQPISWERNNGQEKVVTGQYNTYAIVSGALWVWGDNENGALGIGTVTPKSSPVQVGSDTDWEYVSGDNLFAMAIKGGALYAWGWNNVGQLGLGDVNNRSAPTQIGSATNWTKCFTGGTNGGAINSDGELYVWGNNEGGLLGQSDVVVRSVPVQIAGTTWNSITFGVHTALLTKTDGKLFALGDNGQGLHGKGTVANNVSSPIQVGSETNWVDVRMSHSGNAIALKGNGTIWCWGNGTDGSNGQGTVIHYSAPVQVGSETDWTSIGVSKNLKAAFAVRAGIAYAWGSQNTWGGLGIGVVTKASVPVVIAGGFDDWVYVESAQNNSIGLRTGS
jgi:alpha-tubulin suppressor-like RCC1 family protein|tara:strand:- start:30 stop:1181 length:1152 start_codon:yes stop_codon:yes gene_type:complete